MAAGETIRTFIAIPLSKPNQDSLSAITASFKKLDPDIKWVKPNNIHITLRFLGELKTNRFRDVLRAFPDVLPATPGFQISIHHLGAFPRIQRPRVIWAGITNGANHLSRMAEKIETALCRLGFPKADKPFSPHITLGRVRSPRNLQQWIPLLESYTWTSAFIQDVQEVILYRSTLTPQGPTYDRQAVITLAH